MGWCDDKLARLDHAATTEHMASPVQVKTRQLELHPHSTSPEQIYLPQSACAFSQHDFGFYQETGLEISCRPRRLRASNVRIAGGRKSENASRDTKDLTLVRTYFFGPFS